METDVRTLTCMMPSERLHYRVRLPVKSEWTQQSREICLQVTVCSAFDM